MPPITAHSSPPPPAPKRVNLECLHDRVLVKRLDPGKNEDGSPIQLPESMTAPPLEGIVVAVGPKATVHTGDHVLFGDYQLNDCMVDGEKYLLMRDEDLFAKRPNRQVCVHCGNIERHHIGPHRVCPGERPDEFGPGRTTTFTT